ncbi:MAG: von Willebrand factor type A domain-containing protein [Pirellulales bacterium]
MTTGPSYHDAWLDRRLADVPVPQGFLTHVKQSYREDLQSETTSDLHRPRAPAAVDGFSAIDTSLDASLTQIAIPDGMNDRLKQLIAHCASDTIDEAMRDVALPPALGDRLRRSFQTAGSTVWPKRWIESTMMRAALLWVSATVTYVALLAFVLAGILRDTAPPISPELNDRTAAAELDRTHSAPPVVVPPRRENWAPLQPPVQEVTPAPGRTGGDAPQVVRGPVDEVIEQFQTNDQWQIEPATDIWNRSQRLLTSQPGDDEQSFVTVPGITPRGIASPAVKEYPRLRLLADGVHPFVSPAADQQLQRGAVPLTSDTATYQLTKSYLAQGRLPEPGQIRVEDFLAALDYEFQPPTDRPLRVYAVAGPSHFGEQGMVLLLVGVQAAAGDSAVAIAERVSLAIHFDPNSVARYRLLGHEADLLGGLIGGRTVATIHAGQTAVALFELELTSQAASQIAEVELKWSDPGDAKSHHIMQPVSRLQIATSLWEAALPLQMATVAAETAEALRASPYSAPRGGSLDQIGDLMFRLHPQLQESPELREMVAVAEAAARLRRSPGRDIGAEISVKE